ncbi:MAG: hypothetical protein HY244_05165 [Rhizobiales bacterium]|nr:hypothetical protein [Hyphomicrobiales bacterium]
MGVAALVGLFAFGAAGFVLSQDAFRSYRENTVAPTMHTVQLIAPLAIAVHRYVLLGEVTTGYAIGSRPRYIRFVGFALVLNMLIMSPALIFMVLPTLPTGWGVIGIGAVGGLVAFVLFAVFLMALRRTILFPAIAIDAPGATWTNARNDTKGNSWRVLFILICTAIPDLVISVLFYFMLLSPPGVTTTGRIVFSVLSTVISVLSVCAFAAVASHLFRALANRLAIPPATPRTA